MVSKPFRWLYRRWPLLTGATSIALAGGFLFTPLVCGWTSPPTLRREGAQRAVERARQLGGQHWAPDELRRAETSLRAGLLEHRVQELRFVLRRDYRSARQTFRIAEEQAGDAARAAEERHAAARTSAERALQEAGDSVEIAASVPAAATLVPAVRIKLQRARYRLLEAHNLLAVGEYAAVEERCNAARREAERFLNQAGAVLQRFVDGDQVREWRRWIAQTVDWSRDHGMPAIVVNKERNELTLYAGGRSLRSYPVEIGMNSTGQKVRAGDSATPEGRYRIVSKKGPGQSTYYRALLLDYPNSEDRQRFEQAKRAGRIPRGARLGGLIEIHGEGGRGGDWTRGCVALRNSDLDDLAARVPVGTPVTIVGGDGRNGKYSNIARSIAPHVDETVHRD
ncbi:MAG TPA: L,D-transpeptidase [Candidatus Polarisedimenticolaceae bacterium]|nr:L,D-transpeptidase [Candidatus Polarisedimenticolaceae bacterium]